MRSRYGVTAATAVGILAAAMGLSACISMPVPASGGGTTTNTTAGSVTTTTMPTGARIGPHQHFVGLVNGKNSAAVVNVVCPGPAAGGRTGPPVSGQTVAVRQVASGGGDTGSVAQRLWAQFGKDLFHVVAFTNYDAPGTIPTTLQLPCQGTGTIAFTTCFGTLPCAADAVDDIVTVTFVNIAA